MTRSLLLSLIPLLLFLSSMSPLCSADSVADRQFRNAVAQGDVAAARILLSNGADVDCRSEQGTRR